MIHLHIFLSSPGDVSRERQLAREAIEQLQSERAHRNWLKVEVVAWDKPGAGAAMPASLEPQEAINQGLKKPSECDIVVVILWARMGTRLSEKHRKPDGSHYRSGTEYEFLDAIAAADKDGKPDVLVYRREGAPNIRLDDPNSSQKTNSGTPCRSFFQSSGTQTGHFDGSSRSTTAQQISKSCWIKTCGTSSTAIWSRSPLVGMSPLSSRTNPSRKTRPFRVCGPSLPRRHRSSLAEGERRIT